MKAFFKDGTHIHCTLLSSKVFASILKSFCWFSAESFGSYCVLLTGSLLHLIAGRLCQYIIVTEEETMLSVVEEVLVEKGCCLLEFAGGCGIWKDGACEMILDGKIVEDKMVEGSEPKICNTEALGCPSRNPS